MKVSSQLSSLLTMVLIATFPVQALAETSAVTVKLVQLKGNVMVNQGIYYAMANPGTELKPGAKIVTTKGASVALVYKDGCIRQLKENSIVTVGPATECTAKKVNERVYLAEAVGATTTDAPSAAGVGGEAGGASAVFGINPVLFVAGIMAVTGAAVAVANNSDRNASSQ